MFCNVLSLRRQLAAAKVGLDQGSQRQEAGEGQLHQEVYEQPRGIC